MEKTTQLQDDNSLGEVLYNIRTERLKISLRKAAELIGISHNYLSLLEKGIDPRTNKPVQVTTDIIQKLAEAYEYPLDELMQLAGYKINRSSNERVNLVEVLQGSQEISVGESILSKEDRKKLLIICQTLWGNEKRM